MITTVTASLILLVNSPIVSCLALRHMPTEVWTWDYYESTGLHYKHVWLWYVRMKSQLQEEFYKLAEICKQKSFCMQTFLLWIQEINQQERNHTTQHLWVCCFCKTANLQQSTHWNLTTWHLWSCCACIVGHAAHWKKGWFNTQFYSKKNLEAFSSVKSGLEWLLLYTHS